MKQAILITAYKNAEHLLELIDIFDCDFEFYIHIDKKSKITDADCRMIAGRSNVAYLSRRYSVNWGGMNHLKCILLLAGQALKNKGIGYMHLISGNDYPVKSLHYFKAFPEGNDNEYLENFPVPTHRWYKGGLNRLENYYFLDLLNTRNSRQERCYNLLLDIQEKLHIKRTLSPKLPPLYGGGTWWSLTYNCVKYVVEYTAAHPRLLRRLRYTFIPEEFYFQTIIMNSPFAVHVVNDHLRYIDWDFRNGNCPAVLDLSDAGAIKESNALFARKTEYPVSRELIDSLRADRA